MEYRIGKKTEVRRHGPTQIEVKIGAEKDVWFTEDAAALVASELPEDRANELLSSCEEKMIRKGKARIVLRAEKDIRKGDPICAILDITKYLDSVGMPTGIRMSKSGIIF